MMVAHSFDPSTQEAEAGRSLWVQGQPDLQIQFLDSHVYTKKSCLEKPKNVSFSGGTLELNNISDYTINVSLLEL